MKQTLCCTFKAVLALVAHALSVSSVSFEPASLQHLLDRYSTLSPTHLTGTHADKQTSTWIFEELEGVAELHVRRQPFTLTGEPLWVPEDGASGYGCDVVIDELQIPCYIVQSPPLVHVALTNIPMKRVLVVEKQSVYIFSAEQIYENVTHELDAAIVINMIPGSAGETVSLPRPFDWHHTDAHPSSIPVITLSSAFADWVKNAKFITSLSISGRWIFNATSQNILAQLREPVPSGCLGPPSAIYVGTPINGFFRCAGERGGGIALLISLARDLALRPVQCGEISAAQYRRCWSPIFGFTAGHEHGDSGIIEGILPFLRSFAEYLKVSLEDVPFVSLGANLGMYEKFSGNNSEGRGMGTARVYLQNTNHSTTGGAMVHAFVQALVWRHPSFLQHVDIPMNTSNTEGAVLRALQSGMAAINIASGSFDRFHLPTDAGIGSINISSLHELTAVFSEAFRAAVCAQETRERTIVVL